MVNEVPAVYNIIGFILLGLILGLIGQFIRIGIGLKKQFDIANETGVGIEDLFSKNKLLVSLIYALFVGGAAGVSFIVIHIGEIDKSMLPGNIGQFLLSLITIGYAGTDLVEGLLTSATSKATDELMKECEEEKVQASKLASEKANKLKEMT